MGRQKNCRGDGWAVTRIAQKCMPRVTSMLRRAVAEPPSATACDASPEPTRTGKSGIREV